MMEAHTVRSLLTLALVPAALAACTPGESRDAPADSEETMTEGEMATDTTAGPELGTEMTYVTDVRSSFTSTSGSDADISGTLLVQAPQTRIEGTPEWALSARLTGLTPGEHAWHIHENACPTPGPVVIPMTPIADVEGVATPLVASDDGIAELQVPVPGLQNLALGQENYSVHVHEASGLEHGPSVACATI